MRKRFLVILLAAAVAVGVLAWLVPLGLEWAGYHQAGHSTTDEDLSRYAEEHFGKAIAAQPEIKRLDFKQTVRLAIGGLGVGDENINGRVSDLVLVQLAGAKGLEMVERQELARVLGELNLSAAGLVRARDAVRAGKLLRADWFLLGSPTRLNGTNFTVVRIVSAHTGILREAEVFQCDQPPTRLAAELAGFVRQCRQDAAEARSRVYLAVGGFEDLSVNSRQAGFPTHLRSYLMAAYQESGVTVLEREFANTLLQEVQLDLAGMTDESPTNAGVMQAAYWMVDGSYQSYETTNFEVELVLGVRRLFGSRHQIALIGEPGEALFKKAKERIDEIMSRDRTALTPSRVTEVQAQMQQGKELARREYVDLVDAPVYQALDEQAAARQRRNVEEAMRAFQTALLLSPTNREAKMYLAACLRNPSVRRDEEARTIYRQLLDENVKDKWAWQARQALAQSFEWRASADERARWFAAASQQGSNSPSAEFYRENAAAAAEEAAIERGGSDETVRLVERRLLEKIQSTKDYMEGKGAAYYGEFGMDEFRDAFQGDRVAAGQALARFYPEMRSRFPELAPHLAACALYFQTDTNTPLLGEYRKQLSRWLEHPRDFFKPQWFWSIASHDTYRWFMYQGLPNDAIRTLEGYKSIAGPKGIGEFGGRDMIALAYAYMDVERWKDALDIFESFTNRVVNVGGGGPWGSGWTPILTGAQADFCREKLGLKTLRGAFEKELDKNALCLHFPSDFLVSDNAVWVAMEDELLQLNFQLKTNLKVRLPKWPGVPVRCIALGDGKVWVGTGGAGLMEFDQKTGVCRSITEADGLLMNFISALCVSENRLWIGYGSDVGGGLGYLDLQTRKMTTYMRNLKRQEDATITAVAPPNSAVRIVTAGTPGELWIMADREWPIRRFRVEEDDWEFMPVHRGRQVSCFAADELRMVEGSNAGSHTRGSLMMYSCRDGSWRGVGALAELPAGPTAMALDGDLLWVGGENYIALADLNGREIRKIVPIPATTVGRIQIGGGYVWALFEKHLHRAAVSDIQ